MRARIIELLPEIRRIKGLELQEAVVNSYIEALNLGGWSAEEIDKFPAFSFPDCPISYLCHVRTVTRICMMILEEYNLVCHKHTDFKLDNDRLIAGALLHDIGKFIEWSKGSDGRICKSREGKYLRHPILGTVIAMKNGVPTDIAHTIAYHSHEGDTVRRNPEAVIVSKVDMMNYDSIRSFLEFV